mmetsp:Transcript_17104/g.35129  ORF Transcript_17104/g.35129 Transcript_17104/m.35129 type:complete len:212 (+) Transcript_17104:345-980(+)
MNHGVFFSLDLDFVSGVIPEFDKIPFFDFHFHDLSVSRKPSRSDLHHLSGRWPGLARRRLGDKDTTFGRRFFRFDVNQDGIPEDVARLEREFVAAKFYEDVIIADKRVLVTVDVDFGSIELAVDDVVTLVDRHLEQSSGIGVCLPGTGGHDEALGFRDLRFARQQNASFGFFLGGGNLNQDEIICRCDGSRFYGAAIDFGSEDTAASGGAG